MAFQFDPSKYKDIDQLVVEYSDKIGGVEVELHHLSEKSCTVLTTVIRREDGARFTAVGNANPDNLANKMLGQYPLIADTRGLARAIRRAFGLEGYTADEVSGGSGAAPRATTTNKPVASRQQVSAVKDSGDIIADIQAKADAKGGASGRRVSPAQAKLIKDKAKGFIEPVALVQAIYGDEYQEVEDIYMSQASPLIDALLHQETVLKAAFGEDGANEATGDSDDF